MRHIATIVAAAATLTLAPGAFAQPAHLQLDQESVVGDIGVACTGIGQTKNDPKWLTYPVKVEFADTNHDYLAGEVMSLSDPHGHELLKVACEGPWILLKLQPGLAYEVEGRPVGSETAAPMSAVLKAPAHGQATFVLTFPASR